MKFVISLLPALFLTKLVFYLTDFEYFLFEDPFDFGKLLIDISVFGFFYFIAILAYEYFFGEKLELKRQVSNKRTKGST
ncbi:MULTISPECIES: hypothetical protein [Pseudoalteromonas]|uniref:hypothetical protein n=1 Tax=Pseudoalteromonas TaxID=53246 RepID=UPI00057DE075|nr:MULTISPECIES: hypothetical protein [Pseudoalteromonas]KID33853.1 hypothetical protein QT15_19460 [Pseudoalteromonas flavipulchra NCIMB 2033 = ATCC BAA-314]MBD0782231.1 hypothetical protein [Pseudoalteromonas flavipulchra]MBE0375955.1 hypothetical protein [Pseudoalteromonas flavipulchra NCIMB 2033 = ATCC BAA-314]QUI61550.1 hypothetical protein GSF04_03240 [Pseudoalteromonas sp. A22]RZG12086.1 hypothetical protein EXT47_22595 [Pseudoalteromonas sp. CO342X]